MGKLSRPSSVSVFASQALAPEITVFGSSTESKDVDLVLNGVDAERGWGVVGANGLPSMEWFNAIGYSLSYYSSYLMQAGIAEWVTTQNYYINSRCVGSDGKEYVSLSGVDGTPNVGNNPTTDTVNWSESYKKFIPLAINAATAKKTPVDADLIGIADSAASFALKKLTWGNIKAALNLGFTPVQQGTGIGQLANTVKIGWSDTIGLKATVDSYDLGRVWTDNKSPAAFGPNGYQRLPSGLIIQWGYVDFTTNGQQVNFPISFPNIAGAVTLGNAFTAGGTANVYVASVTNSKFNLYGSTVTVDTYWIAVGY